MNTVKQKRGEGYHTSVKVKSITAKSIIISILMIIALSLLLVSLVTVWVLSGGTSYESISKIMIPGHALICILSFIVAGKTAKSRIAIHIGICACIYIIINIAVSILIPNSAITMNWPVMLTIIISAALACAICIRKRKPKRFKK